MSAWGQPIADKKITLVLRRVAQSGRAWTPAHADAWDAVNASYLSDDLVGVLDALVAFELIGTGIERRLCRNCGKSASVLSCAGPDADVCAGCGPVHGRQRSEDAPM